MRIRNPKYLPDGMIYCELEHPKYGWIPHHASADDANTQQVYARILNGEAGHITKADPEPPERLPDHRLVWEEGEWVQVPMYTPEEKLQREREALRPSRLQARMALIDAGKFDQVENAISNNPDRRLQQAWEHATYFRRLSPMVLSMQTILNWSDEQMDELFRAALLIHA